MLPLVSVICLCHNHKAFLEEAINSVLGQTYSNIEIIVVDDASTDGSKDLLKKITSKHQLSFIDLQENIGNCAAFNRAWALAKGRYVIDFASDDVMMPERVEQQVSFLEGFGDEYGVVFSNAEIINQHGEFIKTHYPINNDMRIPEGDVYSGLLSHYFISPPTMMIKREVLEELRGYDEDLAYEDFDFWIRSSRKYKYAYQDACLTKVRKLKSSLSSKLYEKGDKQLLSTYKVCVKAAALNRNRKEEEALIKRLRYESRHAVLTANYKEAVLFFDLLEKQNGMNLVSHLWRVVCKLKLPLKGLRRSYLKFRYGSRS